MSDKILYLVRHGEQVGAEYGLDDGPLSPRGQRQAQAIADRLGGIPFDAAWHSPLQRAEETAAAITDRYPAIDSQPTALLFDCVPTGLDHEMPKHVQSYFGSVTEDQVEAGIAQMSDAVMEFFAPTTEESHQLLITHNFVIAWLVREALGAPDWRWTTLSQANCGLTIIRIKAGRPPELIAHNDLGHLPVELRTGMSYGQVY